MKKQNHKKTVNNVNWRISSPTLLQNSMLLTMDTKKCVKTKTPLSSSVPRGNTSKKFQTKADFIGWKCTFEVICKFYRHYRNRHKKLFVQNKRNSEPKSLHNRLLMRIWSEISTKTKMVDLEIVSRENAWNIFSTKNWFWNFQVIN